MVSTECYQHMTRVLGLSKQQIIHYDLRSSESTR